MADLDVAFVPTPKKIVQAMLRLASLRRGETLFDLGAGDGRVIIEAARRFGANAIGVEIDPANINRIKERLTATGTKASLIETDMFKVDLTSADVITIYLSASANAKLAPKLTAELKPGTRVVSLDYPLPGWPAKRELQVEASGIERTIYLYQKT
jgi:16S rRNA A1518/A1519 N6-dimethyltransferase RsmA/KsgA/DIM1 with predicted DNA glycosylase/AP lyase activity